MTWWTRLVNKARGVYGQAAPEARDGCDHSSIHLREGSAEFEWFIARAELEMSRDLKHGAGHLASLLMFDPANPEWVELLEKYLAAAGTDPEALIPRGKELYAGIEAMRAYIWHTQGRLADAVGLLADVAHAKRDARYLEAWGLDWLEPVGAIESLPEMLGLRLFVTAMGKFPEAGMSPLPRLQEVERWTALCERFAGVHPFQGPALMVRTGLLRKAGRFDAAEAVARHGVETAPDWHALTALGLVLRQEGDTAGAVNAFRDALRFDPDNLSGRLEAGDTLLDTSQYQPALAWYEQVLAREPKHPWALPSAVYCRWKLSGDRKHVDELVALAKAGNARAQELGRREFYPEPPEPVDATANVLRDMRKMLASEPPSNDTQPATLRLYLTSPDAPSNFLAFRMEMNSRGRDLRIVCDLEAVPHPDPRAPIDEVKHLLWRYEGNDPLPALPPPAADVLDPIARLASLTPFDEQAHWAAASRVAGSLGPDRVGEVLAAMVHPPALPVGKSALG